MSDKRGNPPRHPALQPRLSPPPTAPVFVRGAALSLALGVAACSSTASPTDASVQDVHDGSLVDAAATGDVVTAPDAIAPMPPPRDAGATEDITIAPMPPPRDGGVIPPMPPPMPPPQDGGVIPPMPPPMPPPRDAGTIAPMPPPRDAGFIPPMPPPPTDIG